MKFSQGAWRWAEGVSPVMVRRVNAYQAGQGRLAVHGSDRLPHDKIEGILLSIEVTSPMPDVLRVHVRHFTPAEGKHHHFDLDYALKADGVRVEDTPDELRFTSGRLTLRVTKGLKWHFRFEDEQGRLVTAGPDLGYMTVNGPPKPPLSNGRLNEGLRPAAI